MNIKLLKKLLGVPNLTGAEEMLREWICDYVVQHVPGAVVRVDAKGNVQIRRGNPEFYTCVAAHLDGVQALLPKLAVVEWKGRLYGESGGFSAGLNADDKAGIFVCLELLQQFDNLAVLFTVEEEVGCQGARALDPAFMSGIGCVLEFDCPSRNLVSYTSSGRRLFQHEGPFMDAIFPVFKQYGSTCWQRHPYTDVMALRERSPLSCLNLSCGYYNWHCENDYVDLADTEHALAHGAALIRALRDRHYPCPIHAEFAQVMEGACPVRVTDLKFPGRNRAR